MANEAKSPREIELEQKSSEATKTNEGRSGVGTRVRVGQTRGKNPIVITWEAFDESQPETLPKKIQEFMDVTKVSAEPEIVAFLIDGYNDAQYTAASDPLAEYVEATWPQDAQTQFRLVVRNYSRGAGVDLEEAVKLIKPGFSKQFTS